jgi:hypothetical protein
VSDVPEVAHEALARRRGGGFLATCTCGWYGHEVRDRREATRAAHEHEMRAAQKRERLHRIALERAEHAEQAEHAS